MKRIICYAVIFLAAVTTVFAADYGVLFSGSYVTEDIDEVADGITNRFTGILAPWISAPLGGADFYLSAGMHFDYADYRDEKMLYIPDLFRLEISGKPFDSVFARAGRISWQDPSRLVMKGRYDGADAQWDMGKFRLGAAALYTGLLYYDTAKINYSPSDPKDYGAEFDWSDFDTYFAPRRFIGALYGDFPGLPSDRGKLYVGLLAQFDLSDASERFHTQYLTARHTFSYHQYDLALAGVAQLEDTEAEGRRTAFATSIEGGMRMSGDTKDRLCLGMRWASGEGPNTAAFFPVIREAQGLAIQNHFSGLMIVYTGYETRLAPALSAEFLGRYFLKTDSGTFSHPDLDPANESYFVGAEIGAALLWAPYSDLSFSLAGGVFLPKTGKAMQSDAPVRWSVTLGTIFSM